MPKPTIVKPNKPMTDEQIALIDKIKDFVDTKWLNDAESSFIEGMHKRIKSNSEMQLHTPISTRQANWLADIHDKLYNKSVVT